jgi:hypothetical protein
MIDYLLKFPDRESANQYGLSAGYTSLDGEGFAITSTAGADYALCVIGEHYAPTGEKVTTPDGIEYDETVSDGACWILFRDLADKTTPESITPYIIWSSNMKTSEGAAVARPTTDAAIPNRFWA